MNYRLTKHAKDEMVRRQINEAEVAQVISSPEQILTARKGRNIYQSRISVGVSEKSYLLRIFIDVDRSPMEVVTVYRTSKIEKYWRSEP
jgi:hypothetical protein